MFNIFKKKVKPQEDNKSTVQESTNVPVAEETPLASTAILQKLKDNNGRATIYSLNGKPYIIEDTGNGRHFKCRELPVNPPYEYSVFDIMVECCKNNGGRVEKGNGRNYKLGEEKCNDSTLVGYIAKHYAGKKNGESVYDPVFVLASVLDWADVATNGRGFISLKANFR